MDISGYDEMDLRELRATEFIGVGTSNTVGAINIETFKESGTTGSSKVALAWKFPLGNTRVRFGNHSGIVGDNHDIFVNFYKSDSTTYTRDSVRGTQAISFKQDGSIEFLTGSQTDPVLPTTKMTVHEDGNVGIGTTSPTSLLHVVGNSNITGTLTVGDYTLPTTDGTTGQMIQTDGNGTLSFVSAGTGDVTAAANLTDNTIIVGDGGSKGVQDSGIYISYTGSYHKLYVSNDGTTGLGYDFHINGGDGNGIDKTGGDLKLAGGAGTGTGNGGDIVFSGTGTGGSSGSTLNGFIELARLTASGRFGIGTNNPNSNLHVIGNSYYTGSLNLNDAASVSGSAITTTGEAYNITIGENLTSSEQGNNLILTGGNSNSSVSGYGGGDVRISTGRGKGGHSQGNVIISTNISGTDAGDGRNRLYYAFFADHEQHVGIGTNNPSYTLDVNGDINTSSIYVIGSGSATLSDNTLNFNSNKDVYFTNSDVNGNGKHTYITSSSAKANFATDGNGGNLVLSPGTSTGTGTAGIIRMISYEAGSTSGTGINSNIIYALTIAEDGLIGIGTDTPTGKLHIDSYALTNPGNPTNSSKNSLQIKTTGGSSSIRFGKYAGSANEYFDIYKNFTADGSTYTRDDNTKGTQVIRFRDDGGIQFSTSSSSGSVEPALAFFIANDGKCCVGNNAQTTPYGMFEVNGNLDHVATMTSSGSNAFIRFRTGGTNDKSYIGFNNGRFEISNNAGEQTVIWQDLGVNATSQQGKITVSGYNGVSQISLYATHNIYCNSLTQFSDDRIKENETLLENATESLMKLKPQGYTKYSISQKQLDQEILEYNAKTVELNDKKTQIETSILEEEDQDNLAKLNVDLENVNLELQQHTSRGIPMRTSTEEFGLISQEVYYNAPELRRIVKLSDDANPVQDVVIPEDPQVDLDYDNLGWGSKNSGIDYTQLIPYLIKMNQEQQARIEALEAQVQALQNP